MNNILFTAFNGKNNSSKILLDKMNVPNKLYLKNSFTTAPEELIKKINQNHYDYIISIGQWGIIKNQIRIETQASVDNEIIKTDIDYQKIADFFTKKYSVHISTNAGNYLCNNLYFHILKYLKENNLTTKIIFVHIPILKDIKDINALAREFDKIAENAL